MDASIFDTVHHLLRLRLAQRYPEHYVNSVLAIRRLWCVLMLQFESSSMSTIRYWSSTT